MRKFTEFVQQNLVNKLEKVFANTLIGSCAFIEIEIVEFEPEIAMWIEKYSKSI